MSGTLVISGGSRGIGLATARLFASHGYRVVNISRRDIDLKNAVQISADLSRPGWVDEHGAAVQSAVLADESVVLIHNAGLLLKDDIRSASSDDMRTVLQVNLLASMQLNQLLLPHMSTGSSILYVGSTLSEKAVAGACSYSVSKHAVVGLMRATCQDLAGSGVHTACVCPGFTDTEMLREHVGQSDEVLESIATGVTQGRLVRPEEIAESLYYCATSPVINGAVIHANLGQIET